MSISRLWREYHEDVSTSGEARFYWDRLGDAARDIEYVFGASELLVEDASIEPSAEPEKRRVLGLKNAIRKEPLQGGIKPRSQIRAERQRLHAYRRAILRGAVPSDAVIEARVYVVSRGRKESSRQSFVYATVGVSAFTVTGRIQAGSKRALIAVRVSGSDKAPDVMITVTELPDDYVGFLFRGTITTELQAIRLRDVIVTVSSREHRSFWDNSVTVRQGIALGGRVEFQQNFAQAAGNPGPLAIRGSMRLTNGRPDILLVSDKFTLTMDSLIVEGAFLDVRTAYDASIDVIDVQVAVAGELRMDDVYEPIWSHLPTNDGVMCFKRLDSSRGKWGLTEGQLASITLGQKEWIERFAGGDLVGKLKPYALADLKIFFDLPTRRVPSAVVEIVTQHALLVGRREITDFYVQWFLGFPTHGEARTFMVTAGGYMTIAEQSFAVTCRFEGSLVLVQGHAGRRDEDPPDDDVPRVHLVLSMAGPSFVVVRVDEEGNSTVVWQGT